MEANEARTISLGLVIEHLLRLLSSAWAVVSSGAIGIISTLHSHPTS